MPSSDPWAQFEVATPTAKPAAGPDKWSQYEAAPAPPEVAAAAASATGAASPDLTTNSIDPTTGTGYGLYRMGSYDFDQGQVSKPEIQVPYNRVAEAQAAGYKLHPDEAPRYQRDTAHNGPVSRAAGQVKSILARMTEPMPDRPLNGTSFQNAAAALTNVGQLPFNVVNRAVRGVAGLPQGAAQTVSGIRQGDPAALESLNPATMGENAQRSLSEDTASLGPMAALGNLGGDATTLYLTGKYGPKAIETATQPMLDVVRGVGKIPESLARTVTDTGAGPIKDLVNKTVAANEKIDLTNADRLEKQRADQAQADYDHRANLLKMRQKYEQSVRDATEKARTGTAKDRAEVASKNLAAKQKYEQDVRDAQQKYTTEKAKAVQTNTESGTDYQGKLLKLRQGYEQQVREADKKFSGNKAAIEQANTEARHQYNRKVGEVVQQNRVATAAERAKTEQTGNLQVGGSQLIYGLRQLDKSLRDRAAAMYDAIREKVGGQTMSGTDLAQAAKAAMSKISGTSVTPTVFRDILGKYQESDPEALPFTTSTGGTTLISKGHPMYNFLKENGAAASTPVTFKDLQGYHSELGAELSKGTLPGDVYQATRDLQESVTDMMQAMAKKSNANNDLINARKFYREYMDTFHEPTGPSASGSPVAQALLAKDPLVAVEKFASKSGDRGIAFLRKYSDSLANLAQDVQRTVQADVKVPARKSALDIPAPKIASVPVGANFPLPPIVPDAPVPTPIPGGANLPLPPVVEQPPAPRAANLALPPVLPEPTTVPVDLKPRQTISTPDIVAARRAAAEVRAGKAQTRGTWVATWPVFQAMRALWGGHIPSIPTMALESAGTFATTKAATSLMRYPPLLKFLTEARPEDLALIPPDLRGDLPGLVTQARQAGIKVAPALVAATAGASITPAQAIQAMQPPTQQGAAQ